MHVVVDTSPVAGWSSLGAKMLPRTFSCLQTNSLIFCMFPLSSFSPNLVSLFISFPLVSLAIGL